MTKMHFQRAAEKVKSILDGHWINDLPPWASNDYGHFIETSTTTSGNIPPEYVRAVWTAEAFVSLFRDYNPRFNEQKFLQVCGLVEQPVKRSRKVRSNDDSPAPLSPDGRYMS